MFSVRTETNWNSICFGCFSVCSAKPNNIFFGLFWCFGPVSKQPKQTKLCRYKPKKSPKTFSIRRSSKQNIFILLFEPKQTETQSVSVVFWFFHETQNFFSVSFGVSNQYQNNRNKQNLWYGEFKRLIFYQICCCFGWSFVCFGCFKTPKLPVSILKRNNRNKRLASESAETRFSSSFGCFDTKLVSEDTLKASLFRGQILHSQPFQGKDPAKFVISVDVSCKIDQFWGSITNIDNFYWKVAMKVTVSKLRHGHHEPRENLSAWKMRCGQSREYELLTEALA